MPIVEETNGEIVFIEKVPNGLRVCLFVVGRIPMFLAPYELLMRPAWKGFSLYLVIPLIISVGAIFVGGIFVAAGLFGLSQTLLFTTKSRSIHYSYESALIPLRRKTYRFSDITNLEIKTHDWSDGPSTYGLQFIFRDGQTIETGSFEKREEAEQYLNKVKDLIR